MIKPLNFDNILKIAEYAIQNIFWIGIFILIYSLISSTICFVLYKIYSNKTKNIILGSFTISFVAVLCGYISALSRETVVGDILPLLLTGFGFIAFTSVKRGELSATNAFAIALCFAVSIFVGFSFGAIAREMNMPQYHTEGATS